MTKFEVIIEDDRDNPENNGNVVFGPVTLDRAQGFLDGVAYVNDSALVLKLDSVDIEEIEEDEEEIQRRDEKNGLYPHWWNDSN